MFVCAVKKTLFIFHKTNKHVKGYIPLKIIGKLLLKFFITVVRENFFLVDYCFNGFTFEFHEYQ